MKRLRAGETFARARVSSINATEMAFLNGNRRDVTLSINYAVARRSLVSDVLSAYAVRSIARTSTS